MVVPAYNEERIIACTVTSLLGNSDSREVIVVADGTDTTAKIASSLSWRDRNVSVLQFDMRLGKGGAFYVGAKHAEYPKTFLVDADNPVPLRYVNQFTTLLGFYDVVVASRYSMGSRLVGYPATRQLLSHVFRKLCRVLFRVKLDDFQCGFKAFRTDALLEAIPHMRCRGMAFDVELLVYMTRHYRVAQVPVTWHHRSESRVNMKQVIRMMLDLMRICRG